MSALLGAVALTSGCAGSDRPVVHAMPRGISFAGTWESTWGKLVLRQNGRHVSGSFTGYREGGVSGELDGDVWHFVWDQRNPKSHGRGFMQISPDGQHLEGRWGYMKVDDDGGRWAGDRQNDNTF